MQYNTETVEAYVLSFWNVQIRVFFFKESVYNYLTKKVPHIFKHNSTFLLSYDEKKCMSVGIAKVKKTVPTNQGHTIRLGVYWTTSRYASFMTLVLIVVVVVNILTRYWT